MRIRIIVLLPCALQKVSLIVKPCMQSIKNNLLMRIIITFLTQGKHLVGASPAVQCSTPLRIPTPAST